MRLNGESENHIFTWEVLLTFAIAAMYLSAP